MKTVLDLIHKFDEFNAAKTRPAFTEIPPRRSSGSAQKTRFCHLRRRCGAAKGRHGRAVGDDRKRRGNRFPRRRPRA